ncbi:MAG: prolyl oligopeptidase family serine peptidase [Luteolibacter sp.]
MKPSSAMRHRITFVSTLIATWVCAAMMPLTSALSAAPNPLVPDDSKFPMEKWESKMSSFTFHVHEKDGHALPYRMHLPSKVDPQEALPLVLFLHGAGERGADNRKHLSHLASSHPFWESTPCIILAPQCPSKEEVEHPDDGVWVQTPFGGTSHQMKANPPWPMRLVIALLDETIAKYPVDQNRIYVTGLSMGGYATWDLLQRFPKKFAAAMPICGGGDTDHAGKLVGIPLWVFHGAADEIVPVSRSRDMVQAIQKAGGKPTYTEYPDVTHDSWTRTYANKQVWEWMFDQKRVQ